jgi:hypothetical protein
MMNHDEVGEHTEHHAAGDDGQHRPATRTVASRLK